MINSLVRIDAGTFKRGEQQVTISKAFFIGKYEVTQAQWRAVMGNNPAEYKGADRPVEQVSWNDAMEFCEKLNDYGYAPRGYKFSLPTYFYCLHLLLFLQYHAKNHLMNLIRRIQL